MDDIGVWKTVSGRRIFIKEGQSLESAMTESGKFDDIEKKLQQESQTAIDNMTDEEKNALKFYTEGGSTALNEYLAGEKENFNYPGIGDYLDEAIDRYNLPTDITVYRGTDFKYFEQLGVGAIYAPPVYLSTSLDKSIGKYYAEGSLKPAVVEIRVKKGIAKGIYLGNTKYGSLEKEFLIKRDSSFKVLSINDNYIVLETI